MKVINCIQGSAEWLDARLGNVTASKAACAIGFLKKGGETAERAAYKAALVSEILTGRATESYVSPYMQYGTETEEDARTAYELHNNVLVETAGFGLHASISRFGASPDGLVGKNGMVEFKCPKTETHIDYIFAGILPPKYEPQVMSELSVWERDWIDFMSFDKRMPRRHQRFTMRVYRDEQRIAEIEAGVCLFLKDVDEMIERLNTLNPEPEQFQKQLRASLEPEDGITTDDIAWITQRHAEQLSN